ncbi:hypothetical protein P5P86_01145 [Nocardioides sp. BP30]|uniref:hypothetical protein n=1 Tax=Nocardioides sp. BP30 TaxID=3036374 RepID=UPI0024688A31|nr:hypothetical protein [Nocardioides sp. BP30]WGL52446.1 hypothetical protein P5P86_01145 [Nocardioides sp. BP30]
MTAASEAQDETLDLRRETFTMALYVAICLLAAMLAVPEDSEHAHALGIVWGISIGLVLAHLFAFRLATRLVNLGAFDAEDARLAAAQLAGGIAAAVLASVPVILLPADSEITWAELLLAALIAAAGYAVARRAAAHPLTAIAYGLVMLALAVGVALLKNHLAGH